MKEETKTRGKEEEDNTYLDNKYLKKGILEHPMHTKDIRTEVFIWHLDRHASKSSPRVKGLLHSEQIQGYG